MLLPLGKTAGFTLIELIIVVVVIGILSVALAPISQNTAINVNLEARRVLTDIRFAQAMSMTSGQRYRWVRTSSTTYQITNEAGVALVLPSGTTQLTLTNGVVISGLSNLPSGLLAFDSQGTPYTTGTLPGTALGSTATITLQGSGESRSVQILPQTGFGVLQ